MEPNGPNLQELLSKGDHDALAAALKEGADVNQADRLGVTLLGQAAVRGDLEAMRLLLGQGAEVDRASAAGNTPLMAAAARGHHEAVALLLDHGASPEARNKWGFGPTDWGHWPENSAEILALLRARSD